MSLLDRRKVRVHCSLWALALLAVVALWAGGAQAATDATTPEATPEQPRVTVIQAEPSDSAPAVRVVQAMRVVRDAETGELRAPTAQEISRFQRSDAGLDRSSEGLEQVERAGTTVTVDLKGRFLNASVVTIDAAGVVHGSCVDAPQQAETVLTGDAEELEAARQEVRNER